MLYRLLADLTAVVHLMFIGYVVVGGFLAWWMSRTLWLHIAAAVAEEARRLGYSRLGILGTRYLMEGPVYPDALKESGIDPAAVWNIYRGGPDSARGLSVDFLAGYKFFQVREDLARPGLVRVLEAAGLADIEWYHRGPVTSRGETTERLYVVARKPE